MTTNPPPVGTGRCLWLNSPLSPQSLASLLETATKHQPQLVVDHGCGWGTALLETLIRCRDATGLGIEIHAPDLDRASAAAAQLGLTDRVRWQLGPSEEDSSRADLLISIGAFQAFGSSDAALAALRSRVTPGGRLLFGIEYWAASPTDAELTAMWDGAAVDDCATLAAIVAQVHGARWRILRMHDSSRAEFDTFEVGHLRDREEWLVDHADPELQADQDRGWQAWLTGHRRPMGFVTFVLAAAA